MSSKASAAKPAVGGGVWAAPEGSTLPTDASTALDAAFKSAGYISDAGVTRKISRDTTVVHAWGGDVVAVLSKGKTETFKFKFLEFSNTDVLGMVFGEATGDLTNGITVKSKADISTPRAFVISTLLADDIHQRIAIPSAVITDVGDITYKDDDVIAFDVTITAIADANGNTAYEYQKTIADTGTGTGT